MAFFLVPMRQRPHEPLDVDRDHHKLGRRVLEEVAMAYGWRSESRPRSGGRATGAERGDLLQDDRRAPRVLGCGDRASPADSECDYAFSRTL